VESDPVSAIHSMGKASLQTSLNTLDVWLIIFGVLVAVGAVGGLVAGYLHWRKSGQLQTVLEAENLAQRKEIATANTTAAEAEQRAAEANQKAAEARLELAKFREPRSSVLKGHTAAITERLRPFVGTEFDCGFDRNRGEQADFWWDLQPALVAAGWINVPWRYGTSTGGVLQGFRPETGEVAAANVEIHIDPQYRDKLAQAAAALMSALNDLGIEARDAGFNAHNTNLTAIHILIGEKQ
jgi:hypothetical protein